MNFIALITIGGLTVPCLVWFSIILKQDWRHLQRFRQIQGERNKVFFRSLFLVPLGIVVLGFLLSLLLRIPMPTPSTMMETHYEKFLFFTYPTQVPSSAYNESIAAIAWSVTWPFICIGVAIICFVYFRSLTLPRLRLPLLVAATLLGGMLFYAVHFFFDDRSTEAGLISISVSPQLPVPTWIIRSVNTLAILSRISVLSILIMIQSYLGPVFTGYLLSAAVFQFMVHEKSGMLALTGQLVFVQPPLLMDPALNWIFKGFPPWSSEIFLATQLIFNILMNIIETFGKSAFQSIYSCSGQMMAGIRNLISNQFTRVKDWRWSSGNPQWKSRKAKLSTRYEAPDPILTRMDEWDRERDAIADNLRKLDQ
jgi:hypothetical protein